MWHISLSTPGFVPESLYTILGAKRLFLLLLFWKFSPVLFLLPFKESSVMILMAGGHSVEWICDESLRTVSGIISTTKSSSNMITKSSQPTEAPHFQQSALKIYRGTIFTQVSSYTTSEEKVPTKSKRFLIFFFWQSFTMIASGILYSLQWYWPRCGNWQLIYGQYNEIYKCMKKLHILCENFFAGYNFFSLRAFVLFSHT